MKEKLAAAIGIAMENMIDVATKLLVSEHVVAFTNTTVKAMVLAVRRIINAALGHGYRVVITMNVANTAQCCRKSVIMTSLPAPGAP